MGSDKELAEGAVSRIKAIMHNHPKVESVKLTRWEAEALVHYFAELEVK